MTEVRDPAIAALLAEARRHYAASLPEKVAELRALLDRQAWSEARRAAHKLRGSAGTYGFVALSDAAGAVEDLLIESSAGLDVDARNRASASIEAALNAAQSAAGSAP
jgi:HPt (histidine-containing phosphotransfer) domain-containing protein